MSKNYNSQRTVKELGLISEMQVNTVSRFRKSGFFFTSLIVLLMMMMSTNGFSQVAYTQTWETEGLNGWVGAGAGTAWTSTTTQICATTNSIRTEQYYGTSANFTSPLLGTSNGGELVLSYQYKVTNWSSGASSGTVGVTPANVGTIRVEYGTTATGPWTLAETINSTNHLASASCVTREVRFFPPTGDFYMRFLITSGTNVDSWYYFDDVTITQGAPPTCLLPENVLVAPTNNSATISWNASASSPADGYQWEIRTSGAAGSGATGLVDSGTTAAGVLSASSSLLSAATNYSVYVKSNCGSNDLSAWSPVKTFRTETLVATPWTEGFATTTLPTEWINAGFTVGSIRGATGNPGNNIYSNLDGATDVPRFTTVNYGPVLAGNALSFDFKVSKYSNTAPAYAYPGDGWGSFNVEISADFGLTWTSLEVVSSAVEGWNAKVYPLNDYLGMNVKFRITGSYTTGDFDLAFDNIAVKTPPTCAQITGLTVSNIEVTNATISWIESVSNPVNGYQWEIRASGAAGSGATGLTDGGSTTAGIVTVTSTSLAGGTSYMVYVRSNCGSGDFSDWSVGSAFRTQTLLPAPNTESFATATLPTDWINTGFTVGNADGLGGNTGNSIYKNLYGSATTGSFTTVNYGPVPAGYAFLFDFKIANFGTPYATPAAGWGSFNVEVSADYGTTWTSLGTVNTADTGWNSVIYPLTDYVGLNVKLRISATRLAGDFNLGFDNLAVNVAPTCLPITGLAVSSVEVTNATATWTESVTGPTEGYQWEVRTSGAAGSGTTGLADSGSTLAGVTTATSTNLIGGTNYTIYVRSNCGAGDFSTWSLGKTFTTQLLLPTPWSEGFTTTTLPTGWVRSTDFAIGSTRGATGNPGNNIYVNLDGTPATANFSTVNYGPVLAGQSLLFDFKVSKYSSTAPAYAYPGDGWGNFNVEVSADYGMTWTSLEVVSSAVEGWNSKVYPLGDYVGLNVKLRFTGNYTTGDFDLAFDNIAIKTPPTCLPITGLTATGLEVTAATIEWIVSTSTPANGYQWEIRTTGAAGSGATGLADSGSSTAVTVTSTILSAGTNYTVYVRSNCGNGDFSEWSIGAAFRTETLLPTPWSEGFTTTTLPAGWVKSTDFTIGSTRGATGNPGNNMYVNLDGAPTTANFTTVNYGPVLAGQALTFDFKVSKYSSTAPAYAYPGNGWGNFNVEVSADYGVTWASLEVVSSAVEGWNSKVYPLGDYVGLNVKLRFTGNYTAGDFDLAFDNIAILVPPTCLAPTVVTSSSVEVTTADVSWTASVSNPTSGYEYELRTSGAAGSGSAGLADTGVIAPGAVTTSLSDLAGSTTYVFYVRANCSGGDFSNWASATFTTKIANDFCDNATVITCGSTTAASLIGSTNDNQAVCGITNVTAQNSGGVWYKIAGTGEVMTVSTASSLTNVDTRLAVFTGTCGVGTLNCIGGNDDRVPTIDFRSEVLFPTTVGIDYYVLLYSFAVTSPDAPIILTLTCVPACTPASGNDECANAVTLGLEQPYPTNNTCAGTSATGANPTCGNLFGNYFDTWFTFDSGENTSMKIAITEVDASATVGYAVYSGTCGSLTAVTGGCSLTGALATITVAPSTTYYVRAYSASPASRGNFTLNVGPQLLSTPDFSSSKLNYYPNPVENELTLNNADTIDSVEVYNLIGQRVFQNEFSSTEVKVDMSRLSSGTYIVNVVSKGQMKNIKVIRK